MCIIFLCTYWFAVFCTLSANLLEDEQNNICVSEGCVNSAAFVLANIDKSVNPCDDFYKFACGKFTTGATVNDDKTSRTTYDAVNDVLVDDLRRILDQPIKTNEPKHSVRAKKLFAMCMDEKKLEERETEALREMLEKIGGWPVLCGDRWDESSFRWTDTVYKFRDLGLSVDFMIDLSVKVNHKNTAAHIIEIDRAVLALNPLYLKRGLGDKMVSSYFNYMVEVAVELGAERSHAVTELRRALELEIQLARISQVHFSDISSFNSEIPMCELARNYPVVPWSEYVNRIVCGPGKLCVHDSHEIMLNMPHYLTSLDIILKFTPKRVQANYLVWRAIASTVAFTNRRLRDRQQLLHEEWYGRPAREPRWTECVDIVSSAMHLALGSMYVIHNFDKQAKNAAFDMAVRIHKEMYQTLLKSDWMDPSTRKNALDKVEAIEQFVAYPDELLDTTTVDSYYETLQFNNDIDYFQSILQLAKLSCDKSFSFLHEAVNKSHWITHGRAVDVNAFYNLVENSIQIPAGILQGMFFSADRPNYMNYGGIGYVIGHEITHGFDDQGRLFDKKGNLRTWWNTETSNKFMDRALCVLQQYNNFTADEAAGLRVNGLHTLGENIADNGGVMLAYNAYRRYSVHKKEPRLPGLDEFSPRQMFWISAANIWCSVYRPEALKHSVLTGHHSPGQFRVIGSFQNQQDFANDFSCPQGSYMNPVKKCKVW
ncbi:neprilysin-2-like [Adelges cooleyi]|uniref:neprilysin-2-like n=1 Tax=Adelges cooleyi TaxID=133065 RepID=UPI00217F57CD|nr:neprilysin-2-like [Adelges cooleyi]